MEDMTDLYTTDLDITDPDATNQDVMDQDATNLDTTDQDSDLDSIGLPNTKAVLMCKLVTLLLPILRRLPMLERRLDNLTTFARMQEELDKVQESLHAEMLLIRAWCNKLRVLDSDAINGPRITMTMETGKACEKILVEVGVHSSTATLYMDLVELAAVVEQSKGILAEGTTRPSSDLPHRVDTIGKLLRDLRVIAKGLHEFNEHVMKGRSRKLSTRHVTFKPKEQPLKMMFGAVLQGTWYLEVEHKDGRWKEFFRRIDNWGSGQFAGPFPLDLYYDFAESNHNGRSTLIDGLFYILHYVGMLSPAELGSSATFTDTRTADVELKAIPSTSSQPERIAACRARIENLMKKEEFLSGAVAEWCRSLGVGWCDEDEDEHEDESDGYETRDSLLQTRRYSTKHD